MKEILDRKKAEGHPFFLLLEFRDAFAASEPGQAYHKLVEEGQARRKAVSYFDHQDPEIAVLEEAALLQYRTTLTALPENLTKHCPGESPWSDKVRGFCDIHNHAAGAHTPFDLWIRHHGFHLGQSIAHVALDRRGGSQLFQDFLVSGRWDPNAKTSEMRWKCMDQLWPQEHPALAHVADGAQYELRERFDQWFQEALSRDHTISTPEALVRGGHGDTLWDRLPKTQVRVLPGSYDAIGYGTWLDGMGITFGRFTVKTPIHIHGIRLNGETGLEVMVSDKDLRDALAFRGRSTPLGGVHAVAPGTPGDMVRQLVTGESVRLGESNESICGEDYAVVYLGEKYD